MDRCQILDCRCGEIREGEERRSEKNSSLGYTTPGLPPLSLAEKHLLGDTRNPLDLGEIWIHRALPNKVSHLVGGSFINHDDRSGLPKTAFWDRATA